MPTPGASGPRTSLHASLVASFDRRNADPWLRQILFSFLALSDPSISYNLDALTHPYRCLLENQSLLGAESMYFGYFHTSWVRLQPAYLRSQGLPCERRQAQTLVTTWAQLFQTTARAQWDIRNHHLHEATEGQKPHAETLLRITASELYDDIAGLSRRDRESVFQNMTLAQRLATPPAHLCVWVNFAKPILAYIKKHALPPTANTDIRDFFRPPPQPHAQPARTPSTQETKPLASPPTPRISNHLSVIVTGGKLPHALRLCCDFRSMIVSVALAALYKIGFYYYY
jgi:hypothetical protein